MHGVQRLYLLLVVVTIGSLTAFLYDFFLPSRRFRPLHLGEFGNRVEIDGQGASGTGLSLFSDRTTAWRLSVPPTDWRPIKSIVDVMGSGAGLCDVDLDGDLDLYLVRSGPGDASRNLLFLNSGDGTFLDGTEEAGVGHMGEGMGCVFGDIDNDGDRDLYVTNRGPDVLFLNDGSGGFSEATEEAGLGNPSWGSGAAFGDLDNDGDLDLYVANYLAFDPQVAKSEVEADFSREDPLALLPHPFRAEPDRLYENDGRGRFQDVTERAQIASAEAKGLGVILSDLDVDGDLDIYVVTDASKNLFFANQGNWKFNNVGLVSGLDDARSGMGIAVGDFDNDELPDIFVTNWQDETNALYRNIQSGATVFEDVAGSVGLASPSIGLVGWGTGLFDYDGDGFLDILVVNGYTTPGPDDPSRCIQQSAQLFRNIDGREFRAVDVGPALEAPRNARGAVFGDIDGDGDIDIVITTNRGQPVILENETGNRNRWLKIRLVGSRSNRDGIGARVYVAAGERTYLREVRAGSSYLCHDALEVHFGLGKATAIDLLRVEWPSGRESVLGRTESNQTLVIREPEGR